MNQSSRPKGDLPDAKPSATPASEKDDKAPAAKQREIGGRDGPEPTRYGDWERNGICVDF